MKTYHMVHASEMLRSLRRVLATQPADLRATLILMSSDTIEFIAAEKTQYVREPITTLHGCRVMAADSLAFGEFALYTDL